MSFLRKHIQDIQHTSALNVLCEIEKEEKISIPFPILEKQIKEISKDNKEGIYYGDTIEIYGKGNTGKSYIVSQFIEHTLKHQDDTKVIYINLTQKPLKNNHLICDRLYYFQPMNTFELLELIHGIEKWFYDHDDQTISWVVIDGEWIKEYEKLLLLNKLISIQYHWPFILLYTNRSSLSFSESLLSRVSFYQIECSKQESIIGLNLLYPTLSNIK
ncbi:unnamed protein product [Cunninghamella blakesleeana]